jgi:hypothetical protein
MASRIYVWAAPCPTCRAGKDKPCIDQRKHGITRHLYGRRTHAARREAVRAMGNPRVIPKRTTLRFRSPGTRYLPMGTYTWTPATSNQVYVPTAVSTMVPTTVLTAATATSTTGWTVTRDEIWAGWVADQATATGTATGTASYTWTDEQMHAWRNWDAQHHQVLDRHQALLAIREEEQRIRDAQQRAREEQNRRLLAETQARDRLAQQAHEVAQELFLSLLTAEQRAQWARTEACTVRGSEGGLYELRGGGVHGNISQIDEHGCRLATLCVAPRMYEEEDYAALPTPDGWVGQLLAIRHNEGELRNRANYSYRRGCVQPAPPTQPLVA